MGWASGSGLMQDVITAVNKSFRRGKGAKKFYEMVIEAFQDHDCDTLDECKGSDPDFDAAYREAYPSEDGWESAKEGKRLDENPYQEETSEWFDWESGWKEFNEYGK